MVALIVLLNVANGISHLLRPSQHICGPVFNMFVLYCVGVVGPSPSRPPLLLFPGTTVPIIVLERLSSSLLPMCPY